MARRVILPRMMTRRNCTAEGSKMRSEIVLPDAGKDLVREHPWD